MKKLYNMAKDHDITCVNAAKPTLTIYNELVVEYNNRWIFPPEEAINFVTLDLYTSNDRS